MENEEDLIKEVVELFSKLKEERNGTSEYICGIPQDPNPRLSS